MDIVDKIMRHETGQMSQRETLEFFGELVSTGQAWQLQGAYGRAASTLVDEGYLTAEGEVTALGLEVTED